MTLKRWRLYLLLTLFAVPGPACGQIGDGKGQALSVPVTHDARVCATWKIL